MVGDARITQFRGPYQWLSNFWAVPVVFDGVTYPCVENAYQAAKTLDQVQRQQFVGATAGAAKRMGRSLTVRPDWDAVKLQVMEDLLRQKFADEALRQRLMATGSAELVEGNWWGDTFWGVHMFGKDGPATYPLAKPRGENHLGRLLMRIREESQGAEETRKL